MIPVLIELALFTLSLGISLANHGKPRSNENFVTTLIALAIQLSILHWGGFFNPLIAAIKGGG